MNTHLHNNIKYLVWVLFLSVCGYAQTTNVGVIQVQPGTIFSSIGAFDNQATGTFTNDGESYFFSHFNNDGVVTFTTTSTGERLTRFEKHPTATAFAQQIKGSKTSYFYDVLYNNDNGLLPTYELHSTISVANEADFNEGIVQDDIHGGLIIFEDEAVAISVSDDSHVDGLVQKKGDDSFVYPVGDIKGGAGYYRFAAISAPEDLAHDFNAKYFFETPIGTTAEGHTPSDNKASEVQELDTNEFWTITRENGSGHVALTLSYDAATTLASVMATPQDMVVAYWDDANKEWISLGGLVDETNQTVTTIADLSNYGIFTLARAKDIFTIYNGVSNNGDGLNDILTIEGMPPGNNVKIFNRWGVKVFETDNYDTNGNVFRGYSNGRATIQSSEKLPTGTYFYVISYPQNGDKKTQSGYLYMTTD